MGGILVVRLGAMGDIIHALPAVASLCASFPNERISWLVAPRWMPLLAGNPAIHRLIPFERDALASLLSTFAQIRQSRPDRAFDFQGLLQSAIAGRLAMPKRFWGFGRKLAREPLASFLYTDRLNEDGIHRVERNMLLVQAAGATNLAGKAWLPQGQPDGNLPQEPFVLASPFAGWTGKEWPLQRYSALAQALQGEGLALVLNVPATRAAELRSLTNIHLHTSSLDGLIHATRQAVAVIGLDSGPLHLAAALEKPGVAIFGPTDPAATGPYGQSMTVLRAPNIQSTYKRHSQIHRSMHEVTVDQVHLALLASMRSVKVGHRP